MVSIVYKVHPALQDFVQCIHVIDVIMDSGASSAACLYPPTPQNSLFIYLGDAIHVAFDRSITYVKQPEAVIVGPQVTSVSIDVCRHHKAVRIGFQPGGLYRLLGIPLHEMLDGSYDAADVLGKEIRELTEKLKEAVHYNAIHGVVETYLLRKHNQLKNSHLFDTAMVWQWQNGGLMTMDTLASMACVSIRQFERLSLERLGYSPKFFSRITRFSKAYRMRENSRAVNWTDITYACGYYDQMHLIKDFKQFAGLSPGVLEKELSSAPLLLQKPLSF